MDFDLFARVGRREARNPNGTDDFASKLARPAPMRDGEHVLRETRHEQRETEGRETSFGIRGCEDHFCQESSCSTSKAN